MCSGYYLRHKNKNKCSAINWMLRANRWYQFNNIESFQRYDNIQIKMVGKFKELCICNVFSDYLASIYIIFGKHAVGKFQNLIYFRTANRTYCQKQIFWILPKLTMKMSMLVPVLIDFSPGLHYISETATSRDFL